MNRSVICLMLISLLLLSGCSVRKIDRGDPETTDVQTKAFTDLETTAQTETTVSETETEEETVPVGIYHMTYCDFGTKETYELQTNFKDDGTLGRDLCVFAVFPSLEKELSGQYFLYIWQDAIKNNPAAEGMKIGYRLEYTTPEGKYDKIILRPAHITDELWDYIEVYIYDDVNQDVNAFHSHILDNQMKDETLVTSFKITAGDRIAEVTDIRLTAFMYSPDNMGELDTAYAERHGYTVNVDWYPGRAK